MRRGACSFLGVSAPGAHGLPFSTQYDVEIYTSVWCVIGYACAHVCVMCVCVRVCACVTTTAALISADLTQTTQESVKSSLIRATSSFPWHLGGGGGAGGGSLSPLKKKNVDLSTVCNPGTLLWRNIGVKISFRIVNLMNNQLCICSLRSMMRQPHSPPEPNPIPKASTS